MGSGARAERAAYGALSGESRATLAHTQAMIPILEEQAEMEMKIRGAVLEQELEHTKELYLLADELRGQQQTQPVYVTQQQAPAQTTAPNYMLYIGIGIILFLFLKKKR